MIKIQLSAMPPSLNKCYPTNNRTGGRRKSKRYTTWISAMQWELMGKERMPKDVRYGLMIVANRPRSNADLSNYIKPIEDLLVKFEITPDDSKSIYTAIMPANIKGKGCTVYVLSEEECFNAIKATVPE